MVQITYVRVAPPGTHESHITEVKWYNPKSGVNGTSTVAGMVQFLRDNNGLAYTCDGSRIARVEWVAAPSPYIRSAPDRSTTDNLLSLPRF